MAIYGLQIHFLIAVKLPDNWEELIERIWWTFLSEASLCTIRPVNDHILCHGYISDSPYSTFDFRQIHHRSLCFQVIGNNGWLQRCWNWHQYTPLNFPEIWNELMYLQKSAFKWTVWLNEIRSKRTFLHGKNLIFKLKKNQIFSYQNWVYQICLKN